MTTAARKPGSTPRIAPTEERSQRASAKATQSAAPPRPPRADSFFSPPPSEPPVALTQPGIDLDPSQDPATFDEGSLGADQVGISSNDDDPFVRKSNVERLPKSDFTVNGRKPVGLEGPWVKILDEEVLYASDDKGEFKEFANNPWPRQVSPNGRGNFIFNETRFPKHEVVRGPDGKPLPDANGLQQWTPRNLRVGMATAFEAANTARRTTEAFAGRTVPFGDNGKLEINTHALVDFNAFYSPAVKMLFFGVVPYRLPGETDIKMFELASSWEVVAHETGHALHHALKPNVDPTADGFRTWGESFSDQAAMWGSTQDPERVAALVKETRGNMRTSNSLTRIAEVYASLTGQGTALRDAFHNKRLSDTPDEQHDRSEVLTGAAYKVFERIYGDLTRDPQLGQARAIAQAGQMMGQLNARSTDYIAENDMKLEDVGKAYLKVDKELFGGKYRQVMIDELKRREIFTDASARAFDEHERDLPKLTLSTKTPQAASELLKANVDKLGVGPKFGLRLQSHQVDATGRQIVRVQLTEGRGDQAPGVENFGIMVFRPNGTLEDWHGPIPETVTPPEALAILQQARQKGLDSHGGGMRIVSRPGGNASVEAIVTHGRTISAYADVYSLEKPNGERRRFGDTDTKKLRGLLPSGAVVLTADDLKNV